MPLTNLDAAKDTAPDNFLQRKEPVFFPENYNHAQGLPFTGGEGQPDKFSLNLPGAFDTDSKIYANTPTYFQPSEVSSRYDRFLLGKDNEDINYELQSGWERARNAGDNLVEKFGAYVTQNAGFIGGALGAAAGGSINLINEGFGGDGKVINQGNAVSYMTDNFLTNIGDAWKENVQERSPIYKSDSYTNGTIWEKLGTSSWWLDDAIDRVALTGAMLVPGIAEAKGLGIFGAAMDEAGALRATGFGAKALETLADNPGLYSKIGKALGSDIYKVAAEGVADMNPAMALRFKGLVSAAQKAELYTWNVVGQSALNGREAQVGIRRALKEQREAGLNNMTDEQIEDKAALGAAKGFWYTMPLSLVASVVELPQIFSTAKTSESLLKKFFNKETGEMVEGALTQTVKPSLGKLAMRTVLTGLEHGQNESAQVAVGRYLEESIAGKMVGQKVEKDDRHPLKGIWANFLDNVNDPNGQNNIALGTIQGILMSVGGYGMKSVGGEKSSKLFGEYAKTDARNREFIKTINKAKAARRFWEMPSDFYVKDATGKVEMHEDGSPKINQDRLAEVGLSLADVELDNLRRLEAIQNRDYDEIERLNYKSLTGLAQNFFDDPNGMEYLTNILKFEAKNQQGTLDRINDSRNGYEVTPQVQLSEALSHVAELKKAYDAIDQRHAGFTHLPIDESNKEEVEAKKIFIRDLQQAQFTNASGQIYIKNKLARNQAELVSLGHINTEMIEDPSSPQEERINEILEQNQQLEEAYQIHKDVYKSLVNREDNKIAFEQYKTDRAAVETNIEETKAKIAEEDEVIAKTTGVDEAGNVVPIKKTVSLKTKTGVKELEIGTEYYIGRNVEFSATGKEVYSPGVIKILGENPDGTIRVEDQDGVIKNITKEQFAKADPIDYRKTLLDKKFKWHISNWNTIFEHYGIKVNGKPAVGRLTWSNKEGKLIFNFKDEKGKLRQKEVTRKDFVYDSKKYKHPILKRIGEVTAEQKQSDKEFADSVDPRDTAAVQEHFKVLAELYEELTERKSKTDKLIEDKKAELESTKKEFSDLEEKIKEAKGDKRAKGAFRFKSETRKALSAAMRLSKLQDSLADELQNLEVDKNQIESNINYVEDLLERVDELPNDNIDIIVELDEQKRNLNDAFEQVGKEINALAKVLKAVEDALKYAIDFVHDLVKGFESKYPNVPRILGNEWVEFLKQNPNFLKLKPDYKQDLAKVEDLIAQVEDLDIIPNERSVNELNTSISELQDKLKDLEQQMRNRDVVMEKFEKVVEAYEQEQLEEERMANNTKLSQQFLGTLSTSVQNFFGKPTYEATSKKTWKSVVGGTIAVTTEFDGSPLREHHVRANNFGFRFNKLKNKNAIQGIIVVNNTQKDLIPGLTEHLIGKSGLRAEDVIALTMVQKNADNSVSLVNEFGEPIIQKDGESIEDFNQRKLDEAIYQVFPSDKLELNYKKGDKVVKETMFRETIPVEIKKDLTAKYQQWRTEQLKQTNLGGPIAIEASFGIPEYVENLDDKGKPVRDYAARTSVQEADLVDNNTLQKTPVIVIATTNNSITNGTSTFETPEGRVFLKYGDQGLVKLQNRKFTKTEAEVMFDVLHQIAENALNDGELKERSTRLFDWLNSVIYWGIPKTPEGGYKKGGYNSMYFMDVDGAAKLFISGLGESMDFTPTGLKNRKADIISLIANMYNNADARRLQESNFNNPYFNIIGIDETGEPIVQKWPNYQTFLLSDKVPNTEGEIAADAKIRDNAEIPLVTQMKPIKSEGETNRKGVYFTLKNTVDYYGEQTTTPVVESKPKTQLVAPTQQAPAQQAATQTQATPAPTQAAPAQKATPGITPVKPTLDGVTKNVVQIGSQGPVSVKFNAKRFLEVYNKDPFDISDSTNAEKTANLLTKLVTDKILDFGEEMDGNTVQNVAAATGYEPTEAVDVIKAYVLNQLYPQVLQEEVASKGDPIATTPPTVTPETKTEEAPTTKTGGIQDRANKVKSQDNSFYRMKLVKEAESFKEEDWTKAEAFVSKAMPNIPFYRVKNMIQATNGKQAWGMLHQGAMYVYENAEIGTAYHEVFEAVWKMFAGPEEKQSIVDEFRKRKGSYKDRFTGETIEYSKATEQELKEELAEEFRDAVLNDKLGTPNESKSLIGKLFSQLIDFIKRFFTGKDAMTNTQELFDKIGDGYYAKFNPYESRLAYAKKGIIDIYNVEADETSEFRMEIPAAQVHEIIQHMTFYLLRDLTRTNESLFEATKIPKQKLYSDLKEEILDRMSVKYKEYDTALAKGEITADKVARDMNALSNLFNEVENNWDTLVEKHQEHLKSYSLEFDENDEINVNDPDKSGKENWQNARVIDNFRKMNGAVKLLLAALPETEAGTDGVQPKFSSIGGFTLMEASKVYLDLKRNLHDAVDLDNMLFKLNELAVKNPNYKSLFFRLTKKEASETTTVTLNDIDKNDIQLVSSFFSAMKGQNADVATVFILPGGEAVVSDSTLTSAGKQSQKDLGNVIIDTIKNDKSPYFTYNPKTGKYKAVPEVANIDLSGSNINSYISFLKNIGVDFSESQYNRLTNSQKTAFRKSVEGMKKSFTWLSRSPKSESDTSAIDGIVNLTQTTLDIKGQLFNLGLIKAVLENPEHESTYFNINGEKTQTHVGVNVLSNLYDVISKVTNINQLDGTDPTSPVKNNFKFLLTDVFTKDSSVMLKKLFNIPGDGEKRAGTENLMKPVFVDGLIDEDKGKKKEASKLTQRQRLVVDINNNLDGVYMNLVPGDSGTDSALRMHEEDTPFVTEEGFKNGDHQTIFKNYFIAEVNLARDNRRVAKGKVSTDLRFFKAILEDVTKEKPTERNALHNEIVSKQNKNMSAEELYNDPRYNARIKKAIDEFIRKDSKDTEYMLRKYNIVSNDAFGINTSEVNLSKNDESISQETLDTKLKLLSTNYAIANIELHKLVYSDPYQYSDELKRIKNFSSPRKAIVYGSPSYNAMLDKFYNANYKKGDLAYSDMIRDHFRTVTFDDVWSIGDLPLYKDPYEETDGGGYITIKGLRKMKLREGSWYSSNEKQFIYDLAFEKQFKGQPLSEIETKALEEGNPMVKNTYTPIKPIVTGSKDNGRNYNDIVMHKFALVPISFRLLHEINPDSNLIELYDKMQAEDIDYGVYSSGSKVGTEKVFSMYEKGKINKAPFETKQEQQNASLPQGVNKIPFAIFGIQTEVPSKDSNYVTQGSQLTSLATLDYMEAGVPVDYIVKDSEGNVITDLSERYDAWNKIPSEKEKEETSELYKEIKHNQKLLEAKNRVGFQNLMTKFGIIRNEEGFVLDNPKKLADALRKELGFQEINDNVIAAIEGFKKGQIVLEATPAYQKIRNVLFSIADKNITSQKITGGLKVQIPATALESVRAEMEMVNGKPIYKSDNLKFYRDKDGERVCEIMIARWFKSDKTDKELLAEWYKEDADGNKVLTEEGRKILSGIGFRIPTQKQNSIDHFVIKQFLPQEFGDSVVIPSELVKKAGSDFDIDKLSIYLKNVLKDRVIPFLDDTNSTSEERYVEYVKQNTEDYFDIVQALNESSEKIDSREKIKKAFDKSNELKEDKKESIIEKESTFYHGYDIFKTLPDPVQETFRQFETILRENNIEGVEKNLLYKERALDLIKRLTKEKSLDFLTTSGLKVSIKGSTVIPTLEALVENYNEVNALYGLTKELEEKYISQLRTAKSLKDFLNKSFAFERAKIIAEFNGAETFESFSKKSVYDQNGQKSLENAYIESLQRLVSHPENFERLTKPNSADTLKGITKDINKQTGTEEIDYSSVGNMLKRSFMNPLRQDFVAGKYAIGIAAVGQTGLSKRQRTAITIDTSRLEDGTVDAVDKDWLGDGKIKFKEYNKIKINGEERANLSGRKSADLESDISDMNSQMMDGYVDISKGAWIMQLGAKPNVASTYLFLLGIGVPSKSVSYFMKQPIIQDYLRTIENNGYSWLFIDSFRDDVLEEYAPSKDFTSIGSAVKEIPSDADLFKMLEYNKKELVGKMDDLQKSKQQFILKEFLKYAMMSSHVFQVTQASNYDTASINDPYSLLQKRLQLEKARRTIISSVDDLMDASFIGELKDIMFDVRDLFSLIFVSDKTKNNSGAESVREVMESVLTPYALSLSSRDFTKVSQKAISNLFDWAMQTDRNQNQYLQNILLGSSTEQSAAKQIIDYAEKVKADKNHPLHDNIVINSLRLETGSKKTTFNSAKKADKVGKPDNLSIVGLSNKVYDQNQIITSFEEIKDVLLQTNKPLYGKLVRLAILQSGLANSPISFTSLLPYEDFVTTYNESLSKLENMPNLANFKSISAFERENYNNTDIVPFKKATLRLNKNGDYYNPSEAFVPDGLKSAMDQQKIQKVINVSLFGAEGRSDFITYSWESRISKNDKIRARKAGDRSYINKALMQKVYRSNGEPLIQEREYNGKVYKNYIYKAINAWGDSFRANEFYDYAPVTDGQGKIVDYVAPSSVFDNEYVKVEKVLNTAGEVIRIGEAPDSVIEEIFDNGIKPAPVSGSKVLRDGNMYNVSEINPDMLRDMGYSPKDVERISIESGFTFEEKNNPPGLPPIDKTNKTC